MKDQSSEAATKGLLGEVSLLLAPAIAGAVAVRQPKAIDRGAAARQEAVRQ